MEPSPTPSFKQSEPLVLRLDRGGRRGKSVTLVDGLRLHPQGKLDLLASLKKRCGAGGTLKEGKLELQGDHREFLKRELEARGYKTKVIG
jgi:translation initiation factor 1